LATSCCEPGSLVQPERQIAFDEELFEGARQGSFRTSRGACSLKQHLRMGGAVIVEEMSERGDHRAGSANAVTIGDEVGELAEPPRRISESVREAVGLVACPIRVALPASAAHPQAQPADVTFARTAFPWRLWGRAGP